MRALMDPEIDLFQKPSESTLFCLYSLVFLLSHRALDDHTPYLRLRIFLLETQICTIPYRVWWERGSRIFFLLGR